MLRRYSFLSLFLSILISEYILDSGFVLKSGQRFFAINNKLQNAKGIEENKKIGFLIDNLLYYLEWTVMCVNIVGFPNQRQKLTGKK